MNINEYWIEIGRFADYARRINHITDTRKGYPNLPSYHIKDERNCQFAELNKAFNGKITCFGAQLAKNLVFVPWIEGKINVFPINNNDNVVSYEFTGCYMVKFSFFDTIYAAHIHSSDMPSLDCKMYWNVIVANFHNRMEIHALFKPTTVKDFSYNLYSLYKDTTIAGVIEKNNLCSTLIVNRNTNKAICVNQKSGNLLWI